MSESTCITRIVVPTDGLDERHPAGLVAADIGSRLGVPVELLSAVDETGLAERFDLLRNEAQTLGARIGVDVIASDDVDTTIAHLRSEADTLVCLASSGQMALTDAAKRSISAQVLTEFGHPVLVVGPRCRPLMAGRRLAIAVDGTPDGERIVESAIDLADALMLIPTLYQVLPSEDGARIRDVPETGYLATLARSYQTSAGELEYDVLHDRHPGAALERLATDPDVAMIALCTHGVSPMERLLTPSVAHRLIRHATCPVLVALRHASTAAEPYVRPMGPSVAVGVEGLDSDAVAVAIAVDEALSRRAALQIVHVWQPSWSFAESGAVNSETEAARQRAQAMIDQVAADITSRAPDLQLSTWLTDGIISTALATAARDAEVLVLGERQYGAIEELLFVHMVDAVLSRTSTPVIVVPDE